MSILGNPTNKKTRRASAGRAKAFKIYLLLPMHAVAARERNMMRRPMMFAALFVMMLAMLFRRVERGRFVAGSQRRGLKIVRFGRGSKDAQAEGDRY